MEVWKISLFLLWFTLLVGVILAISFQDHFYSDQNEKIAKIDSKFGDIMYRQEGLVRWRDAVDSQEFADGDWVTTGQDATATIAFMSGQVLRLGPDTQVQMRSILQGDNDYSYMVTLSRGAVVAEVKRIQPQVEKGRVGSYLFNLLQKTKANEVKGNDVPPSSVGMVVRSGNRSVAVDSGKKIALFKDVGKQEITTIAKTGALRSRLNKASVLPFGGLKATFLPPIAKVFPEKIGAIVFAKEAVLLRSSPSFQAEAHHLEGASTSNAEKISGAIGDGTPEALSVVKISSEDVAALSANVFSPRVYDAESRQIGAFPAGEGRELDGRAKSKLPVLKIKDKIDRLDAPKGLPANLGKGDTKSAISRTVAFSEAAQKIKGKKFIPKRVAVNSSHGIGGTETTGVVSDLSAKGHEHVLNIPNRLLDIQVFRAVSSLKRDKVKVGLLAPSKRPKIGELRPVVELIGKVGTKIPLIEASSAGDLEVFIPLDMLITYGRAKVVGAFKEFEVSARAGSVLTIDGHRTESFERAFSIIKLRGYGDGSSQGITVGLDRLVPVRETNFNTGRKEEIAPSDAPIRISIESENDLPNISPFIQAASRVGMVKGGPGDELGYFVVRKKAVVAEVGGPGLNKKVLELVTSALHGDFVFKGLRRSLHDSRDKSQKDIATWIESLLDQGKILYVMKRDRLYPVSRDFVKTNAEVAQFIDSQAKAVFVEKVDVITFR